MRRKRVRYDGEVIVCVIERRCSNPLFHEHRAGINSGLAEPRALVPDRPLRSLSSSPFNRTLADQTCDLAVGELCQVRTEPISESIAEMSLYRISHIFEQLYRVSLLCYRRCGRNCGCVRACSRVSCSDMNVAARLLSRASAVLHAVRNRFSSRLIASRKIGSSPAPSGTCHGNRQSLLVRCPV